MLKKYVFEIIFFASLFAFQACTNKRSTAMPNLKTHAIRLKPGADLKKSIQSYVNEHKCTAAWISTAVGSLTDYHIRFANQPAGSKGTGHFEIVSLVGTLSENGSHIHISISDSTGKTTGGHLMDGCIVYTTAEIVILSDENLVFKREKDGSTPWEELQIEQVPGKKD
jgi:predicted DNA-binding protein with PD1-like motif